MPACDLRSVKAALAALASGLSPTSLSMGTLPSTPTLQFLDLVTCPETQRSSLEKGSVPVGLSTLRGPGDRCWSHNDTFVPLWTKGGQFQVSIHNISEHSVASPELC